MKSRFTLFLATFLMVGLSAPTEGKNRPTVDSPNGDTCFLDPTTDKNCPGTGDVGEICYCCYDDGCWICGVGPVVGGDQCVWDDKYRAALGAPPLDGLMSIGTESGHHATQDALMSLLEKKNVVTRKELLEETMRSRRARVRGALEGGKLKDSVAAQKKINRYFQSLVPKLKPCWDRVQGTGTIEMKYLYAEDGKGGWALKTIEGSTSDLPKGQDEVAVSCMRSAVTGTSFPKQTSEKGTSYVISWNWPVPMPADSEQQIARMLDSSGGQGSGCDGRGASPRCVTCSGSPLTCVYVCVGSTTCEVQATKPGGFNSICTEGGKCASGGLFGLVGVVMY